MSNFSKETFAQNFQEGYKQLTEKEKEKFSELCFKLLNENYIYGQKADEKEIYYAIEANKEIIANYFDIIDYELVRDSVYKIYFLKSNRERNSIKLKKLESVILLLLRKLYYEKSKTINSDVDISVTYDELLDDINKTGIYKDVLNKTSIQDSLAILKRYKVLSYDKNHFQSSDALTIFPTILYAVSDTDINNLQTILQGYGAKEEDETDEANNY